MVLITGMDGSENAVVQQRLRMRCPACHIAGTFDARGADLRVDGDVSLSSLGLVSAERVCPNPECRALVFVIYDRGSGAIRASYPPERFDFDASDLPEEVKEPLEETIDCHAHENYKAAALMIRRTMEAVCSDRGAEGKTLFDRIEALGEKVVLPKEMINGLHDVRLLGNDAAHVEARDYLEVGKDEVEAALTISKLILAAAYQTGAAMEALQRLKAESESPAEG